MYRLLVVEHEKATRDLLQERLQDAYEIVATGSARDALALALQQAPDCILVDLMMPQSSGLELCQTLGSLSHTQLIPICVMAGDKAEKYKAFCQGLGAAEYFEKPLDLERLRVRLTEILESRAPQRRTEVRVGLRVALRLEGTDARGARFVLVAITEDVSAGGFRCGCTFELKPGAVVGVFLINGGEHFVGEARVVRSERQGTAWPLYGFQFVSKASQWVLE